MRKAGQEHQQLDAVPLIYLDEHGRYLPEQRPPDPPDAGDESATLLGFLERQRATFAWKCSGLDAAGLRHRRCLIDELGRNAQAPGPLRGRHVRRVAARAGATSPVE